MSKNKQIYKYILYGILLVIIIFVSTYISVSNHVGVSNKNNKEGFQSQPIGPDNTQIYIINLEKNKERLNNFHKHYQKCDLQSQPVERINAIYGMDLPYKDYIAENPEDKGLTPGMIGCYLSHLHTYQKFLDSGKPYAIIFEDDAKIQNKDLYKTTISKLHNKIPDDWDMILLGYYNHEPNHRFDDEGEYYKFWNFYGLHCYIINRDSAQKLLDLLKPPFSKQIDLNMTSFAEASQLNIYGIKKVDVVQDAPYSDVQTRKET